MTGVNDHLQLVDWRRRVTNMYANVRAAPEAGRRIAWHEWRSARNDLFRTHAQSPLSDGQRSSFRFLDYFPYDAAWRIIANIEADPEGRRFHYHLGEDGNFTMKRLGWAMFAVDGKEFKLALYWIEGYGGGIFLPFKDATGQGSAAGDAESYGGGRYLYDTIKGADLGARADRLVLDFNYAYNPSCAYHSRWLCPLAPRENRLSVAVTAGEKCFRNATGAP